jgi:hypothetical protein
MLDELLSVAALTRPLTAGACACAEDHPAEQSKAINNLRNSGGTRSTAQRTVLQPVKANCEPGSDKARIEKWNQF